ncbi:AAA family ATPase [Streptomyces sp. NBC_01321]|uniref:AAA family ATPase n=1 Tax=Streptomyces sp. NBC_01321 TaxID=2903825 RepID=UPI002E1235E0|nr:AAA family ATPase [Streptomyces sp. NBC_01321]
MSETLNSSRLIKSVLITELFGYFNHPIDMSLEKSEDSPSRRLTLLYGDNGTGKTTILNLLWNALSASRERGHRSYLANCPFRTLTIHLNNGDEITATKTDSLVGDYVITVQGPGVEVRQPYMRMPDGVAIAYQEGADPREIYAQEWRIQREFSARSTRNRFVHNADQVFLFGEERKDSFVDYLTKLNANPYFLADDRQIYGDDIGHMHGVRRKRPPEPQEEGPNDTKSALGKELDLAMKRFNLQMQQSAFAGSQTGSRDTNKIYLEILRRVADRDFANEGEDEAPVEAMLERLNRLASRTQRYSEFELMPALRSEPFVSILKDIPTHRAAVAEEVIFPYLEAQEARLDALKETEKLIRTFVEQANGFLKTKRLVFDMSQGIRVLSLGSDEQELSPFQLSSGERQILLLLTNTTLARQKTRLFLIDEPELSLNVKWQRKLMSALLACTEGSGMQFVVATHSIEVITGNQDALARLSSN